MRTGLRFQYSHQRNALRMKCASVIEAEATRQQHRIRSRSGAAKMRMGHGTWRHPGMSGTSALHEDAGEAARHHTDSAMVGAVIAILTAEPGELGTHFQQLSGPIMAKAMEDTLYYRDCRPLALNEVGGSLQDGLRASAELAHHRFGTWIASQPRRCARRRMRRASRSVRKTGRRLLAALVGFSRLV